MPFQEVLLCSFPVSLCSSFQGTLGNIEAVHHPHYEVWNLGADGDNVWPLGWIWSQTPDRTPHNRKEVLWLKSQNGTVNGIKCMISVVTVLYVYTKGLTIWSCLWPSQRKVLLQVAHRWPPQSALHKQANNINVQMHLWVSSQRIVSKSRVRMCVLLCWPVIACYCHRTETVKWPSGRGYSPKPKCQLSLRTARSSPPLD